MLIALVVRFSVRIGVSVSTVRDAPPIPEKVIGRMAQSSSAVMTYAAARRKFPQSGGVFRMETNVTGMPSYEFAV